MWDERPVASVVAVAEQARARMHMAERRAAERMHMARQMSVGAVRDGRGALECERSKLENARGSELAPALAS